MLDCGLTPASASCSPPEATVVAARRADAPPWLLKTVAPLAHPAEVDGADRRRHDRHPAADRADRAAPPRPGGRRSRTTPTASSPEWGELLDLASRSRGARTSPPGSWSLGGDTGAEVLRLMDDRQEPSRLSSAVLRQRRARLSLSLPRPGRAQRDPLHPGGTRRAGRSWSTRLAAIPPFAACACSTRRGCACAIADGAEPYVLHHFDRKPWLGPIYHGLYSRLLSRLWLGSDVALRGAAGARSRCGCATASSLVPSGRGWTRSTSSAAMCSGDPRAAAHELRPPPLSTASPTAATSSARWR